MPNPYLPSGRRGNPGGLASLPVGTPSSTNTSLFPKDSGGSRGGIFGSGVGPDFGLGLSKLFIEGGQGVTSLVQLLAPGSKTAEPGFMDVAETIGSSVSGTALRMPDLIPDKFSPLGGHDEDETRRTIGRFLGEGADEEAALTPMSYGQSVSERGFLPTLVEDIGNVSLVAGAVTAPVKGASMAARLGGATETSARLALFHEKLISNPGMRALQHPYRTAGKALRESVTAPAAARVADAAGSIAAPVGAGTKFLSTVELRLQGRDTLHIAREETRLADMERKIAARSPAVRDAVTVAREHIIEAGKAEGLHITRPEASLIVGDEIRARLTGTKALEDTYLAKGVSEADIIQSGIRERFIPTALRANPDLEPALLAAVDAHLTEQASVRATLLESRKADKGLTGLGDEAAVEPALTKSQATRLKQAEAKLERAHSAVLDRQIAREVRSREKYIAAEEDTLGRIAAADRRLAEQSGQAIADFEHSRTWTPKTWRGPGAMEATAAAIHAETLADVGKRGGMYGGASYNPHTGEFVHGGQGTGYAVGLIPGTALEVPVESFMPGAIEEVVRVHQDVFQHPNTIVGTWLDKGKVSIDPSEIVQSLDDALIRGAARGQEAVFDIAKDDVIPGILKDRPDIATAFIKRHKNLSRRMTELRRVAEVSGLTETDVALHMDVLMRRAQAAVDKGLVKHPDEFFSKYVSKFEFGKRPTRRAGALSQKVQEAPPKVGVSVQASPDGGFNYTFEAKGQGHLDVIVNPATKEAYVDVIVTHPLHRRKGVADALMDQAFEQLGDDHEFKFSPLSEDGERWLASYMARRSELNIDPETLTTMAQEFSEAGGKLVTPEALKTEFAKFYDEESANLLGGHVRSIIEDTNEAGLPTVRKFVEAEAAKTNPMDLLDEGPGDLTPLLQRFRDKTLGEFVPLDDGTRGVIRIFEDGNFGTLIHEDGHLLRRMLPNDEMRTVERLYGVKGRTWTPAHEERFADDYVNYMRTGAAPKGLDGAFARVREVLRETWDMVQGTFRRRTVHPELTEIFNSWLDPAVRASNGDPYPGLDIPEAPTGTLLQQASQPPKLPKPPAKDGDFYAAGRKGQKALANLERLAARKRQLSIAAAQSEQRIETVRTVLTEGRLPSQLERDALVGQATRIEAKVAKELGRPSVARTPAKWAPLWGAYLELEKLAADNPALGEVMGEMGENLHTVVDLAISKGFDPTHVRDFTPAQVRRLVFGNMRLGRDLTHETEAGTRKAKTGRLARAGGLDRSIEAFLAASVEAFQEKRANNIVTAMETRMARTIEQGGQIPDGWQLWDPMRTYLLTGTELSEDALRTLQTSTAQSMIVPDAVISTLQRFTQDQSHPAWGMISKVTSPWRTLVLTLSPGWYVRNVVGNVILATAEGANLRDWVSAWKSYKAKDEIGHFADLPFVTSDTLAQEATVMADNSVIPMRGVREAMDEGGKVRGTAQFAARKMLRVNEVVDEIARASVYHRGLRLNMTPEQAWHRAKEALVDYNALSPLERSAVRAVVPFYAWQKGILKVTVNQALDHPARVAVLSLLGQLQDEYLADRFGVDREDIPGYYKHLIGDRNVRSFNPFADPSEIVTVEGITRSMNPFIELALRKGYGAPEFYTDKQRLSYFGTPQSDVDVPSELAEMLTRSPGARIIGEGPGANLLGVGAPVDDDVLRSRFLRARRQIRGVTNPETGGENPYSFAPPKQRSAA